MGGLTARQAQLAARVGAYAAHRQNGFNQVILFVCSPALLWTMCVWLAYSGPLLPHEVYKPHLDRVRFWPVLLPVKQAMVPNGALLLMLVYSAVYQDMDARAGCTWSIFVAAPIWVYATMFHQHVHAAWLWAIPVHVLLWLLKVWVGHVILEHRQPALVDCVQQGLTTGPLFAWMRMMFLLPYTEELPVYNLDLKEAADQRMYVLEAQMSEKKA
mmetsp:Transcript_23510/g.69854  ORF Transcript_23510/g.69854 Transcript_23510/m.69854 type:complete len:214 (-) Transcript_23510:587-1228(-)